MIYDKKRSSKSTQLANAKQVGTVKWKAPSIDQTEV